MSTRAFLRTQAKLRLKDLKKRGIIPKDTNLERFWPIFLMEQKGAQIRDQLIKAQQERESLIPASDKPEEADSFILDSSTFLDD